MYNNLKTIILSITSLALFSFAVQASPLLPIGDSASIFFEGSSSLIWQSNIFYDIEDETSDLMVVNSPGLGINIGDPVSDFNVLFNVNYEFQNFLDENYLDDGYLKLRAISFYKGARLKLSASASFDEQQTSIGEQGQLGGASNEQEFIQLDQTHVRLNSEYAYSPKFSFGSGVGYNDREFKNEDRFTDLRTLSAPLDLFYALTPKVDLSVGYQYRYDEVGSLQSTPTSPVNSGFDREGHFVNIGARGELSPKLDGFFKIGYRFIDPEDSINRGTGERTPRNSDETLGVDAEFTHLTTPKLSSKLKLSRGFDVGSEGQSLETTSAKLNFSYAVTSNYSANAFFDYTHRNFKDGNDGDDFIYRTGFNVSYAPNQYWRFSS